MLYRIAFVLCLVLPIAGCGRGSPDVSSTQGRAAMSGEQVVNIAEAGQILTLQSLAARRVTVVEGMGYFPVLARLDDGTVVAVLRGAGAHMGIEGRLDLVFSSDDGDTWSSPQTVVDGPHDDRNPALGVTPDGTLVLAYAILTGYRPDGSLPRQVFEGVYVIRSKDKGRTWDAPTKIDKFPSGDFSPYGKIINLDDGSLLMHIYAKDDLFNARAGEGRYYSYVARSTDGGVSWNDISLISAGGGEVALLQTPDKRVLAAMRSTDDNGGLAGGLHLFESSDRGKTWSQPRRITFDREHPGDLIQLEDGRIILAHGERNFPMGAQAMISHDGGASWSNKNKLALSWQSPNTDTGYPSSLVRRDGKILTVYYRVNNLENAPQSAICEAVIWEVPAGW